MVVHWDGAAPCSRTMGGQAGARRLDREYNAMRRRDVAGMPAGALSRGGPTPLGRAEVELARKERRDRAPPTRATPQA